MQAIERTDMRYGRLVALRPAGHQGRKRLWLCRCDCGNEVEVPGTNLTTGNTRSCGCLLRDQRGLFNLRHGHERGRHPSPEYRAYHHAKARCINPNEPRWLDYGGRGIEFRFKSFHEFLDALGEKPSPTFSLDRIDNEGHYEPGNVRWATRNEQARNARARKAKRSG